MTDNEICLVIKLWENGKSASEIARLLPYKEYRTMKEITLLKKNGTLKKGGGRTKARTLAKILEVYEMGETNPYTIANILNMKVGTVNTYLTNSRLKRKRPTHNYKKTKVCEKTKLIIEDIKNGGVMSEIAKKHNVSRQYVYNVKEKYYEKEN